MSGWAKANAVPDNEEKAEGEDAAARDMHKPVSYTHLAVGYIIYAGIKWTIAVIATPATGGGSLDVAGAMP